MGKPGQGTEQDVSISTLALSEGCRKGLWLVQTRDPLAFFPHQHLGDSCGHFISRPPGPPFLSLMTKAAESHPAQ